MYRQGDILIVAVGRVAAHPHRRPVEGGVLAFGEATGHAHRVEAGEVFDQMGERYIVAGAEGARVVHDEHDTIVLPEGSYRVIRQREFSPEGDRRVAD